MLGKRKRKTPKERLDWKRRLWFDYVKPIGSAVLIALLIRQFVIQAFRIPSGSMERTLLVGDFLFVNKFLYGAKSPERLRVPLVNWTLLDGLPVLKLPAFRAPRQGDIIVFEYPLDRDQDYIKRCVGVAGDRIQVVEGRLLVNGREYEDDLVHPDRDTSLHETRVLPHTHRMTGRIAKQSTNWSYGLADALSAQTLTPRRFADMIEAALAAGVGLDAAVLEAPMRELAAHLDGSAPMDAAQLSALRVLVRQHCREVDAPFVVPEGMLFMMGDNRFNSRDSRYWGPLDVDLVKGKALFIYWSWDAEKTLPRLNRIGDLIR